MIVQYRTRLTDVARNHNIREFPDAETPGIFSYAQQQKLRRLREHSYEKARRICNCRCGAPGVAFGFQLNRF